MASRRNVIITGAGGEIGGAAARDVLARGDVNVVAVDINGEGLRALERGATAGERERLHCIEADVGSPDAVKSFVDEAAAHWEGLDGIFNIVGIAILEPFLEQSVEHYQRTMAVNARATWVAMKHALPYLLERGGGRIVNTGSHLADRGMPQYGAYAASKHAVVGMTEAIALEYARDNIVANTMCPGGTDTKLNWETYRAANPENPRKVYEEINELSPQGRQAFPSEPAKTGTWLLLDSPAHVNGELIHVDGAMRAA